MSNIGKKQIKKALAIVVSVLLVGVLGGCSSILPKQKEASHIYRLSIPTSSGQSFTAGPVINLSLPSAPHALNGTDIVLSPDGRRLTAAAGAVWAEPVPAQFRRAFLDAIAADGAMRGVIPQGGTNAQYWLNVDIREFEAVFDQGEDQAPLVTTHIVLNLTQTGTRKLLGTRDLSSQSRASARRISSIVEAQDEATQKVLRDAVDWLKSMTGVLPKPDRS